VKNLLSGSPSIANTQNFIVRNFLSPLIICYLCVSKGQYVFCQLWDLKQGKADIVTTLKEE